MSLSSFLLSPIHYFQCAVNVQGVRDDSSLHPEKNLSSSSREQFLHSLVYLSGPLSLDIYDDVVLPNVISWEPSGGGHTWWSSLLVSFLCSPSTGSSFLPPARTLFFSPVVIYKSRIHCILPHLLTYCQDWNVPICLGLG